MSQEPTLTILGELCLKYQSKREHSYLPSDPLFLNVYPKTEDYLIPVVVIGWLGITEKEKL